MSGRGQQGPTSTPMQMGQTLLGVSHPGGVGQPPMGPPQVGAPPMHAWGGPGSIPQGAGNAELGQLLTNITQGGNRAGPMRPMGKPAVPMPMPQGIGPIQRPMPAGPPMPGGAMRPPFPF